MCSATGDPGRYAEPRGFIRGGHAGDDFVGAVDLFVACFGQDVLAGGVLWLGQLGALDDALVEVVI